MNLAYDGDSINNFFSNASPTGKKSKSKTKGGSKPAAKKSSKKKTTKEKGASSHLKPRKPIQKQKGVLAFPEDQDYRAMDMPAKKKFVSAEGYLGDQYE